MTHAHFLTVDAAVRSSAGEFEATVLAAFRDGTKTMSEEQLKDAFYPELLGTEFVEAVRLAKAA